MRKRATLVIMLALTMAFSALSLGSEPSLAAGQTFHLGFSGKGADAFWTTSPFEPIANVVCADTFISVAGRVCEVELTLIRLVGTYIFPPIAGLIAQIFFGRQMGMRDGSEADMGVERNRKGGAP